VAPFFGTTLYITEDHCILHSALCFSSTGAKYTVSTKKLSPRKHFAIKSANVQRVKYKFTHAKPALKGIYFKHYSVASQNSALSLQQTWNFKQRCRTL